MTAFAVVVQKRGTRHAVEEVAEALGSIGGAYPAVVSLGACALLLAPLHHDDPDGPVVFPAGIGVAGQIVLEGRRDLASMLRQPTSACGAALAGAAYLRWGESCTDHLSGEYAFALWDPNARTLLCARDGMGLRLLYVADSADTLVVTNVLAAALRHPAIPDDPDDTALIGFLAHGGAVDEVRTPYRHVRVLPAGHTLAVDTGRGSTRMHRHWRFPVPDPAPRRGEASVLEEYRSVLAEAVGDRVSKSRMSIFLSGGVDSTTIAAAAREVAPSTRLHAITTRYPRYVADDELRYVRAAAESLGLPLTVINADRYDAWHARCACPVTPLPLDEPMLADWRDAVACAAGYGTVALYGEDGDALFCPPGWRALRNAGSPGSIAIAAARYAISEKRRPYLGLRCRERLGIRRPRRSITPLWLTEDASAVLARSDRATILGHAPEPLPPHPTRPETQARLTSTTYCRDFASTISADVTRQRVELRFPLFDTRLVQLVVSLPAIPWCQHKALPRRAYRGRLPQDVLDRPKTTLHGFNDALVAAWQRSRSGALPMPGGKLAAWIDHGEWTRTLELGRPEAVMAAWRVLALDTWIAAAQMAGARSSACTP
jgi:asparagine synthase (glutamine-hydrolysing)